MYGPLWEAKSSPSLEAFRVDGFAKALGSFLHGSSPSSNVPVIYAQLTLLMNEPYN